MKEISTSTNRTDPEMSFLASKSSPTKSISLKSDEILQADLSKRFFEWAIEYKVRLMNQEPV